MDDPTVDDILALVLYFLSKFLQDTLSNDSIVFGLMYKYNCTDRVNAIKNITKIKNDLMRYELVAEDLSGDTLFVEVSATKKTNLDKLKESILLQSEILDLKASFTDKARGVVIESKIDKGKGPVSTILIVMEN